MQDEGLPPFIAMIASAVLIMGVVIGGIITGVVLLFALQTS